MRKANHKHEYFRYVAYMHIRRFNGTITTEKYKFSSKTQCIECGHTNRNARKDAIEIEVTPREFKTHN